MHASPASAYDFAATWEENCLRGPRLPPAHPVPSTPPKTFLGRSVRSRLGIAAGLLPNAAWVLPFARRGYDILTYKTVRSVATPPHPFPNWVLVDDPGRDDGAVVVADGFPADPTALSSAVCFGMPSPAPDAWRDDVRRTRDGLGDGQLLLVSVVGTPRGGMTSGDLADDFATCAGWARDSGADGVEVNLSCPNVCSAEGHLHHDPAASRAVVARVRGAVGALPVLAKIGIAPDRATLRALLHALHGVADGITLVNCVQRPVVRADGAAAFGEGFLRVGVLGRAIHVPSVRAVAEARHVIDADRLRLTVVAVGGASTVADVDDFFAAGADAVQFGSAPAFLPGLAVEAKTARPDW